MIYTDDTSTTKCSERHSHTRKENDMYIYVGDFGCKWFEELMETHGNISLIKHRFVEILKTSEIIDDCFSKK